MKNSMRVAYYLPPMPERRDNRPHGTGQQRLGHRHLGDLGRPRQHSATPVTVKTGFRGNLCDDSKSDILDRFFGKPRPNVR
jgi:hypothetical protein